MKKQSKKKLTLQEDLATRIEKLTKKKRQESLYVVSLTKKNKIIAITEVTRGSSSTVIAPPKEIFYEAIMQNAEKIIIAHNHPSGDSTPSKQDCEMTGTIKENGYLMNIPLEDHLVIGDGNFFSYKLSKLL